MTNGERSLNWEALRPSHWFHLSPPIHLLLLGTLCVTTVSPLRAETARGVVYHDHNENGQRDAGEPGLPDVRVSNGLEIVRTAADGSYQLPVDDDTILFVIKPRNWITPLNAQRLPQFYYIHKPAGSPDDEFDFAGVEPTGPLPASVNFALTPHREPHEFSVIMMGDPQPYDRQQLRYYANDVVAELVDSQVSFGISLGDIVGNRLSLFKQINEVQAKVGVPWHNVHGNHDLNFRSPNDKYADETFERYYGPVNYAFQWAAVHFIVLDNVLWKGMIDEDENGKPDEGNYVGSLSDEQLRFVANYVAEVPTNECVVICTHIPLTNPNGAHYGTPQLPQLLEILSKHPHQVSFSAHTHYTRQDFVGGPTPRHEEHKHAEHKHPENADSAHEDSAHEDSDHEDSAHEDSDHGDSDHQHAEHEHPISSSHHHFQLHHHHNTATGSGSWYRGPKDEQGFPMTPMRDGVPNGYLIATFTGNQYKLRYKAARKPAAYQMAVHAPDVTVASQVGSTEVLANVFNGNAKTKVRMRVRGFGDWSPMTRTEKEDPAYRAMYERDIADADRPHTALPPPIASPHIWAATLPAEVTPGVHVLEVESTDMFGQIDRGIRLIEVDPDPPAEPALPADAPN